MWPRNPYSNDSAREHTFLRERLLIPMIMAMLSEKFWGKDTYEFKSQAKLVSLLSVWLSICRRAIAWTHMPRQDSAE
jgi:hypothetical protein